ncbi:TetR/AcrR family transcriptional regulator [Herpetosiphon giganteus]|uniref:TetR/AcrR family transcriptional regulator n=1 Tax=Herpetosiphon giganteus TaxID=2029754 RepID=UPI00195B217F|nr:TetR/AcrR family transcriptional regulator [Herpetosiphon giganteus]MBM7846235.1 AcrR family transcriptional regulator [Herpetosiphon giganteus]
MARTADPHRRQAILSAAREVFMQQGYTKARMLDIAARAEMATGTLYLYFDSKQTLAMALADSVLEGLTEVIVPILALESTPTMIRECVQTAIRYSLQHTDLFRLLGLEAGLNLEAEQQQPSRLRLHAILAEALAQRMQQGSIYHYQPLALAEILAGLIEWVVTMAMLRGESDVSNYEPTLLQFIEQALLPVQNQPQQATTKPAV